MKVVIVKEKNIIRALEGKGTISGEVLSMRSRLSAGEIKYYELDYDTSLGIKLDAYIETLNEFPDLLNESSLIKEISFLGRDK
ncbi:glutamate racemase [Clostridium perfringens]|uniref:glutamate racemase n=1 Tax=Clostridium perfringens TaxID=1502 RepID=UPI0028E0D63B|nr:glutamate racemase [Clostridium perfringens]MDT9337835.1 glutamate racemase [Clostridium perfringens]MDT9345592.1 glutamate racemase [Clostridium perfringens]MDT9346998.1 glutamate racemase [Clostridium perfringens]MDT9354678.1 glutamate racemase [Clostridium perfringens]